MSCIAMYTKVVTTYVLCRIGIIVVCIILSYKKSDVNCTSIDKCKLNKNTIIINN